MKAPTWFLAILLMGAGCLGASKDLDTVPVTSTEGGTSASPPGPAPEPAPSASFGSVKARVTTTEVQPIAGAEVSIVGTEFVALSDEAGIAVINDVPPGTYTIKVSKDGYQALQQQGRRIQVVAEEIAEVTLIIDPLPASGAGNSYHKTLPMNGFIACSVASTVFGYANPCRGVDPNDNATHVWGIDNIQILGIVSEVRWQPSIQALGSELYARLYYPSINCLSNCPYTAYFSTVFGRSPLRAVVLEGSNLNVTSKLGVDPKMYPRPLMLDVRAYCASPCVVAVMLQQRYDAYETAFYGAEPDANFTALPP